LRLPSLTRVRLGTGLAWASIAGRRAPLFVGWSLTDACEGSCLYCGRPPRGSLGLDETRALSLVDEMTDAGVCRVSLTGGNPLLYPSVLLVAERLARGGVEVTLNSNGERLRAMAAELRDVVRAVTVSVDGGRSAHDAQRGDGSWRVAVEGAQAARSAGITVSLHAVITALNIGAVGDLLDLAGELDCRVGFTIVEETPAMRRRDLRSLFPTPQQWRGVVDDLLARKRAGERRIQNSVAGLQYLRHWPEYRPIRCSAGLVYARIETDGRLYGCGNLVVDGGGPSLDGRTFSEVFDRLARRECRACWCDTRVEMNLILERSPSALRAAWKR